MSLCRALVELIMSLTAQRCGYWSSQWVKGLVHLSETDFPKLSSIFLTVPNYEENLVEMLPNGLTARAASEGSKYRLMLIIVIPTLVYFINTNTADMDYQCC